MCRARALRLAAALSLIAFLAAACSEAEGPVGSPGGRNGIALEYVTPRFQAVPAGSVRTVTLALKVLREEDGRSGEPVAGMLLEAVVEEGDGRIENAFETTGADGKAVFTVSMPPGPGKTRVLVMLESDRRSWLPFETASAPVVSLDLAAGEIRPLDAPPDGVLLRLPGAPGAEYILIPHQTDVERAGAGYRFLNQGPVPDPEFVAYGIEPPAVPRQAGGPSGGTVPAGAYDRSGLVPSREIAPFVNIESCQVEVERAAPLRYLGERIALYVDAPADRFQPLIDSLGQAFDAAIYPTNTRIYGPTTDLDGNGRVLVILTPELEGRNGVYCDTIRNFGVESFYATWNPDDPIDRALGTMAHEHQHVVNAGHHYRTRGAIGDDRWLNEGMSYAAEILNGYWNGALLRMWDFLKGQNGGHSLMPADYVPAFASRDMMFLLYLYDRFGEATFRNLGVSGKAGITNVETVTGLPFEKLLAEWFVAIAVSNRGVTGDPRYNYTSINIHGMEAEIAACSCVAPSRFDGMSLEEMHLETPFDIWRRLDSADADYFLLSAGPEAGPEASEIYFDAYGLQTLDLTIVRLR